MSNYPALVLVPQHLAASTKDANRRVTEAVAASAHHHRDAVVRCRPFLGVMEQLKERDLVAFSSADNLAWKGSHAILVEVTQPAATDWEQVAWLVRDVLMQSPEEGLKAVQVASVVKSLTRSGRVRLLVDRRNDHLVYQALLAG